MTWDIKQLTASAREDIQAAADSAALEAVRIKYLGRKGLLPEIYAGLAKLPPAEKPAAGKQANNLRQTITAAIAERKEALESRRQAARADDALDVTLPGVPVPTGTKHLLMQTIEEICGIFEHLGFAVREGPEIETEFNNFTALNIPVDHPSRDAFDTFYLEMSDPDHPGRHQLLRSHTSTAQVRIMQTWDPPLAVVVPGKVYRPDAVDASHSFMFHQIEGLLVDEKVTFAELKGLLQTFCRRYFGPDVRMRLRPHYFPFTEPSAEVDIASSIKQGQPWLEIMGCGMVHPHVFAAAGYPKGKYTGLAFGMGVERMAMLKHGINDIRIFYENDVRFLKQFPGW